MESLGPPGKLELPSTFPEILQSLGIPCVCFLGGGAVLLRMDDERPAAPMDQRLDGPEHARPGNHDQVVCFPRERASSLDVSLMW